MAEDLEDVDAMLEAAFQQEIKLLRVVNQSVSHQGDER